jgi:pyruvate formate lyase activating enzyme
MHEALFYEKIGNNEVKCMLCPWLCTLKPGQTGICKVRMNEEGTLETMVYDKVAVYGTDPIEKKPLYHFYPGKKIFSVGETGCNLHCDFCQNYQISQCHPKDIFRFHNITGKQLVEKAAAVKDNIGIAYTYNEPFTFYEFMRHTARLVHEKGLKNVVVSNGYVNQEPLLDILPLVDALNIDLKAFGNSFYKTHTRGRLEPVLHTLKQISRQGKHLEISNLVIAGLNDKETEFTNMVKWIADEIGPETPLHLLRYFPAYKLTLPVTPFYVLKKLYELAKKQLDYVYIGNSSNGIYSVTTCPTCGKEVVQRNHYDVTADPDFDGSCTDCGTKMNFIV